MSVFPSESDGTDVRLDAVDPFNVPPIRADGSFDFWEDLTWVRRRVLEGEVEVRGMGDTNPSVHDMVYHVHPLGLEYGERHLDKVFMGLETCDELTGSAISSGIRSTTHFSVNFV